MKREDWMATFWTLADKAAAWDWLNILLIVGGFLALFLMMIAQFTRGDGWDLRSLVSVRVAVGGKEQWTIRPGMFYQLGGFMVTTWGFIFVTVHNTLNEMYLLVYAVAWLASPALNQMVASRFPVAPPAGGTATTETTATSSTTTTVEPKP